MRILLVDDKQADLELLCNALQNEGAEVDCAASDRAAYEFLDRGLSYDLLITDLDLGYGTTGFDVARAARARWPQLEVAYMSAYDIASVQHVVEGGQVFAKPIRMADLARQILESTGLVEPARSAARAS